MGNIDHSVGPLTPGSYRADEPLLQLGKKISKALWLECLAMEGRRTHVNL